MLRAYIINKFGFFEDNGATAAIPATKGPTSITDAIKEKSFEMEADKVKSASTDGGFYPLISKQRLD